MEKEQREAFVMQLAQEAIVSTDPRLVRIAMIYMRSLYNFPWAYQYEQELQQELMRLEQMTQGMQQIGASDLQNQWQGQLGQQGGQPMAGAGVDEEGLAILSQRMAQAA